MWKRPNRNPVSGGMPKSRSKSRPISTILALVCLLSRREAALSVPLHRRPLTLLNGLEITTPIITTNNTLLYVLYTIVKKQLWSLILSFIQRSKITLECVIIRSYWVIVQSKAQQALYSQKHFVQISPKFSLINFRPFIGTVKFFGQKQHKFL